MRNMATTGAPSLIEALTAMFNALVSAFTAIVTQLASWIEQNAGLIAGLVMIGIVIALVFRYGRRLFEMIRGIIPV